QPWEDAPIAAVWNLTFWNETGARTRERQLVRIRRLGYRLGCVRWAWYGCLCRWNVGRGRPFLLLRAGNHLLLRIIANLCKNGPIWDDGEGESEQGTRSQEKNKSSGLLHGSSFGELEK